MGLVRYLQHWLGGAGPRLQVADFVPDPHPLRQWADTLRHALYPMVSKPVSGQAVVIPVGWSQLSPGGRDAGVSDSRKCGGSGGRVGRDVSAVCNRGRRWWWALVYSWPGSGLVVGWVVS